MSNKKLYKETFDSIQMSEDVFRKVKNMNEHTKLTPKRRFKFYNVVVASVATFALLFISSNTISYAVTGNTLLENVTIYMNGDKVDDAKIKSYTDENGKTHYEMEIDAKKGSTGEVVISNPDSGIDYSFKTTINISLLEGTVKQEGDQVVLVIEDNQKKIVITEDFKDGTAEGTFTLDGVTYEYLVEGTIENNTVNIQEQENEIR